MAFVLKDSKACITNESAECIPVVVLTGTELAIRKLICCGSELRYTAVTPILVGCETYVERIRNTYDNLAARSNNVVCKSSGE